MSFQIPPTASVAAWKLSGCVRGVCIIFGGGRTYASHRSVLTFGI